MSRHRGKIQTRRELFTTILRYATLAVLAVIGLAVAAKRRKLLRDGICINQGICGGCGIFEECGLPLALSAKQLLTRTNDE